jgi:NH3-dependent NAD+ synthetase
LNGSIDLTNGVLVKEPERGGGDSSAAAKVSANAAKQDVTGRAGFDSNKSQKTTKHNAMEKLISILDDLSTQISSTSNIKDHASGAMSSMRGMVAH